MLFVVMCVVRNGSCRSNMSEFFLYKKSTARHRKISGPFIIYFRKLLLSSRFFEFCGIQNNGEINLSTQSESHMIRIFNGFLYDANARGHSCISSVG